MVRYLRAFLVFAALFALVVPTAAKADDFASVAGTILGPDGAPLPGICVVAWRILSDDPNWVAEGDLITAADGLYDIGSLPPANYKINFYDCTTGGLYDHQWYPGGPYFQDGTLFMLGPGDRLLLDDFHMPYAPPDVVPEAITIRNVRALPRPAPRSLASSRRISVLVNNYGPAPAFDPVLTVTVCPRSIGSCEVIYVKTFKRLEAFQERNVVLTWDGGSFIGEVKITAEFTVFRDRFSINDRLSTDSYVVVGGSGLGVNLHA